MSTGIFRRNIVRELEEIPQHQIDYWCQLCQFPLATEGKCTDKAQIQECWDKGSSIGNKWHLQHECPFAHKGEACRCNDFKTINDAFRAAGLP